MENPIIEKKNYSDQIFDYLFEEIKAGRMKPGDKLPNERDLSAELGVSRPSLREALRAMIQLGLISSRQGGGNYINDFDDIYLRSVLKYMTVISDDLVMDLIHVRKPLEAEAASLAAINATEEDLELIDHYATEREELYRCNREALNEVRQELNRLDYLFHKSIAEASDNRVIAAFIAAIYSTFTAHQNKASERADLAETVSANHREIVNALKSRDPKKSWESMYRHIETVEQTLLSFQS